MLKIEITLDDHREVVSVSAVGTVLRQGDDVPLTPDAQVALALKLISSHLVQDNQMCQLFFPDDQFRVSRLEQWSSKQIGDFSRRL